MDFESPDEIERSYTKRTSNAANKKQEPPPYEPTPTKKPTPKFEDMYMKEPQFDNYMHQEPIISDSEYGSEYEQPANTTESSIDESVESESDFEDGESGGGFRRLDSTKKKQLVIKDGRIIKDKHKGHDKGTTPKITAKRMSVTKTSAGPLAAFQPGATTYENIQVSPESPKGTKDSGGFKVNGIKPIDVAAHLKLLGESLTIIGERLKEHEGQIAVSGSLSVLLDSLLCALGPLLCLTQQIPELQENCCSPEQLLSTLDNVAFIMPGL